MGTIYLICFDSDFSHARHYIGYAANGVKRRIEEHEAGNGARLLAVLNDAGVGYSVVRTWRGTREDERRLKRQKNARSLCPNCREDYLRRRRDQQRDRYAKRARGEVSEAPLTIRREEREALDAFDDIPF